MTKKQALLERLGQTATKRGGMELLMLHALSTDTTSYLFCTDSFCLMERDGKVLVPNMLLESEDPKSVSWTGFYAEKNEDWRLKFCECGKVILAAKPRSELPSLWNLPFFCLPSVQHNEAEDEKEYVPFHFARVELIS